MKFATRIIFVAAIAFATIGCDRFTKRIATRELPDAPRSYLAGTVTLDYTENAGGFLGLGADWSAPARTALFTIGTGVGLIGMAVVVLGRQRDLWSTAGLSFLVAGGLSNWIDRLSSGHVVDFILLGRGMLHTGVFNVADAAISAGGAILLTQLLAGRLARHR